MKKNMKKVLLFSVFGLFVLMFAMQFVVADAVADAVEDATTETLNAISSFSNPIFTWILGESSDVGELILKVLAFFMVAIIVFGVTDSIGIVTNKWLNAVLGIIVAVIGIRFIPDNMLTVLTVPSSAFVLILFLGIPFAAFFMIVKKLPDGYVRRLAWSLYAILIVVVVAYNMFFTSDMAVKSAFESYWLVYSLFAGAALLLAIMDGTMARFSKKMQSEKILAKSNTDTEDLLISKMKDISDAIAKSNHDDEKVRLQNQYNRLQKNLDTLQGIKKK